MSSQPVRSYLLIATAIVIAGVLISASLFVAVGGMKTTTITTTSTSLGTITSTTTTTAIGVVTTSTSLGLTTTTLTKSVTQTTTVTQNQVLTTTVTTTSASPQPCNSEVWNESAPTPYYAHTPVLLMKPGTTGYICVTYQTAWKGNQTLFSSNPVYSSSDYLVNGTYQFLPFLVVNYQGCSGPTGGASCKQIIYHSFTVTALPNSVRPTGTMDYVTVIYGITAPGNSTGFYDESAPWTGCIGMPMAVGYAASQVNASDFTQGPLPECPVILFLPVAEYVTDMSATYVDLLP